METKKPIEQLNVPLVKEDLSFDEALDIHREAIAAIQYWKDQKDSALHESRAQQCLEMMHKWGWAKSKAEAIIRSHQLRMF